jgi:hypothetical protein
LHKIDLRFEARVQKEQGLHQHKHTEPHLTMASLLKGVGYITGAGSGAFANYLYQKLADS